MRVKSCRLTATVALPTIRPATPNRTPGWTSSRQLTDAFTSGCTTFCAQAGPDFSPRYLEIEEFGALNFGGGNAQYCLETDEFDWACG